MKPINVGDRRHFNSNTPGTDSPDSAASVSDDVVETDTSLQPRAGSDSPIEPGGLIADASGRCSDRLRTAAAWSVILLGVITVTGAAVRLTGSGLGCTDWPNCTESSFVAPWEFHAWIEFGNRLVTGLVAIPVLTTALLALRRRRSRPGVLGWAVVVGLLTLANAIVGAITVRLELTPPIVMIHFLLSMATFFAAVLCHDRARRGRGSMHVLRIAPRTERSVWALTAISLIVLTTGTVVTGTGPHGGDPEAERFNFTLESVARLHSLTMWAFGLGVIVLAVRAARPAGPLDGTPSKLLPTLRRLLVAICIQGAIGYAQFFWGVPPLLVAAHVAGAVIVWWHVIEVALATRAPAQVQSSR